MKRILLTILLCLTSQAAIVNLIWDPNPETNIVEYRVYVGTVSRLYERIEPTTSTQHSVTNLTLGTTYYFAVTAVNTSGLESDYSNEVVYTVPSKPTAPTNPRALLESVSWRQTKPTKSGTVTPILIVPTDPGVRVTAQIVTPSGQVTRSATAGTSGTIELAGKSSLPPFTASADLTAVSIDPDIQSSVLIE
jgi:hypothetical protein